MPNMLPDVHFDDPLLNDTFDFSRYPMFKTRNVKLSTMPCELRHRVRGRALFAHYDRGSPPRAAACRRARNVSEPELISSTNCMRESWFTNLASAHSVGDVANLSSDGNICTAVHPSQSTTVIDTPDADSRCDMNDDHLQKTFRTTREDSCDISGRVEPSDYKGEEDSLYSTDSADQDVHPLLLSMPVIPQIKLERKATIRKPDPGPMLGSAQNQAFLSPRIRDLRTPARISSRRYGRILVRSSPQAEFSDAPLVRNDDHDAPTSQASRQSGSTNWNHHTENGITQLAYVHSASEPMLSFPWTSDDEKEPLSSKEIDESPHSDVLLSMIEEVGSSSGPHSDRPGPGIDEPLGLKRALPKHLKHSHRRSSVNHSISFSSIVHAVADGCASLDLFLRKPKAKLRSTIKLESHEYTPHAHDPTYRWAPNKQGQIIIKVFVPSTDDIWMFRVPQDISLADFTSRVATKLGFAVSFSGSLWDEPKYYFATDERFKSWVKGRIRFGRNLPIVAHVFAPLPLVRLSVDGGGCEVWCYA